MKRLFYLVDQVDSLESISDDLHDEGITDWQLHVLSRDEAGLFTRSLHRASLLDRTDIARYTQRGAIAGALFSLTFIITVNLTGALAWPTFAWVALLETGHQGGRAIPLVKTQYKRDYSDSFSVSGPSMSPLTRLVTTLLLSIPALGFAQAQEDSEGGDSVEEGGLALSAYANTDDTSEFQLGFGGRLDRGLGYFYIGHFETLSRASVSSGSAATGSIPENRYRSTRIGLYAEGHDASTGEGFGFGTFLYHNRSELVIDRHGLGATFDLAYVAAERVRLSGGVDLMPEYLSTDWDSDAMLEYEWHADLRFLVHPKVDIGINWRAGRTNDRKLSTRQYEEVTAGFRLVF